MHTADAQGTLEGREEAKSGREKILFNFFSLAFDEFLFHQNKTVNCLHDKQLIEISTLFLFAVF